ncbi:MAG: hypothetical protein HN948_08040 [Clostridia bacterium]|jgi:membrane protein implicated in regulation of membrane protease activity|nr:hypothetical protein [Clostridia bacterium]MBT7122944.1 hypothetical protein [Clostridia bacterium]
MTQWWESLSILQQVFYYIAAPFTVILLIQTVMTLIGLGNSGVDADSDGDFDADVNTDFDADIEADFDGEFEAEMEADFEVEGDFDADGESFEPSSAASGFRFFTVRGIVAFFCIFGWTGAALYDTNLADVWVVILAVLAGFLAMFVIGLMFFGVRKLQSSGNIKYSNAIGKTASVYIPIPPQRQGTGKVMVNVQERLTEADAITDEQTKIGTGEKVKITGTVGTTLIVKR